MPTRLKTSLTLISEADQQLKMFLSIKQLKAVLRLKTIVLSTKEMWIFEAFFSFHIMS